ncbi:SDR family oxidoreductase [Sphingomonas sp.]|uniref:SDR family oxidoreductase n=1 Tax=Sphingomonas sp. TaxID=28214 RepID=UPI0025864F5F|nr:SDR family oxidoreductase [Sphingomonas sp.]
MVLSRIVLITGAAAGIGLATAHAFARGGDTVVLSDIDGAAAERAAEALGPAHQGLALDISDERAIVSVIARVAHRFGRIDVLVNNAGIVDPEARPALDVPLDAVQRLIDVNLTGTWLAAREAGRVMLLQGEGSIVNIASGAALAALPGRAAYGMTKAAVLGFTRALACEWAGRGVRVNAVLPGYVETEILASLRRQGRFDPAVVERAIPLGRLGHPAEIAAVIRHVAGATYMAGASIIVDGGVDAFGGSGRASSARAPSATAGGAMIVTGGASGIGAAVADRAAATGESVVVFDRDAAAIAALPGNRVGIVVDVTDGAMLARATAAVEERYGRINTLVNSAGVADIGAPSLDQQRAGFEHVLSTNLSGALVTARAVAPGMAATGGGSIVNLASIAAVAGLPGRNGYCAAQAGLSFLTKALACEWAMHGIRVNAVAPGYIQTPAMIPHRRDADIIRRRVPIGRLGTPTEIADTVMFLASSEASYVTGATWLSDGGITAHGGAEPASP